LLHLHKIASISTNAPRGNAANWTVDLAGKEIGEEVYIDYGDPLKGREVYEMDGSLYNIVHSKYCCLDNSLEIFHDLLGLF